MVLLSGQKSPSESLCSRQAFPSSERSRGTKTPAPSGTHGRVGSPRAQGRDPTAARPIPSPSRPPRARAHLAEAASLRRAGRSTGHHRQQQNGESQRPQQQPATRRHLTQPPPPPPPPPPPEEAAPRTAPRRGRGRRRLRAAPHAAPARPGGLPRCGRASGSSPAVTRAKLLPARGDSPVPGRPGTRCRPRSSRRFFFLTEFFFPHRTAGFLSWLCLRKGSPVPTGRGRSLIPKPLPVSADNKSLLTQLTAFIIRL